MTGRLASPRFRRKLARTVLGAGSAVGVVVSAIAIGNTGHSTATPTSTIPAWTYHQPKLLRLTRPERAELLATSLAFVRSAVVRKDIHRAYAMTAPEFRGDMTPAEWDTGEIPVVPFPAVGIAAWKVDYAYENDVALDLALVAKPTAHIIGKSFLIELKRTARRAPWRVAAWVPQGVSSVGNTNPRDVAPLAPAASASLSARWLLVPAGVFALILLVPIVIGIRSWHANSRATRDYYRSISKPS